jgi:2',3'-cyclic-nucleotide 2'-phosphodiesterase / 3'-nucleotidase
MSNERLQLVLLETSDLHGHILPVNYANNQPEEYGLAKIAALIRREREQNEYVILIDNGDLLQGTPLAYYHAKIDNKPIDPSVQLLNELGYDAAVIGNHEFNYGLPVLKKAIRESKFPWLSANLVERTRETQTEMPYFGKPYIIREFGHGLKVAVLGLTTPYIPNWENPAHIEGIGFLDAVGTARYWVEYLRKEEQADIVVVSYHGGFESSLSTGEPTEIPTGENQGHQLCMEVPGIDVLLTGHQHRMLSGIEVNGVIIVQPGSQGRALGKVRLEVIRTDGRWRIIQKSSELLYTEGVEADPRVLDITREYEMKTQQWLDQPIGHVEGDMRIHDPMEARIKDTAAIEFINRVQMHYSGADISNTALFDNDSLGFGPEVTMRDVVSNYIYPNTLQVIRITGQDIRDALEQSAAYFETYSGGEVRVSKEFSYPKPQHYNYDMWEGIDYLLDISRPAGERVVLLEKDGKPLDPTAEYDVAMNNYRAGGGGNYRMFQGKPIIKDFPTDVSELIASFILERRTIQASCDHNWKVIQSKK